MRLTNLRTIFHLTFHYGLPMGVICYLEGGFLLAMGYGMLLFLSEWIFSFVQLLRSKKSENFRLNSIQLSHFVEKVRWVLDTEGIPYEEEVDCGILGVLFSGRTVPVLEKESARLTIGNSAEILAFLAGAYPSSKLLCSSYDSSSSAQPPSQNRNQEMFALCDEWDKMGRAIQQSLYARILGAPGFELHKELALNLWGNDPQFSHLTPAWQRAILRLLFPFFRHFILYVFQLNRPQPTQKSDQLIANMFEKVNQLLSDGRQYLMATSGPTLADITFCSLCAPLLGLNYGGFNRQKSLYDDIAHIPYIKEFSDRHRNSPAGQYVIRVYSQRPSLNPSKKFL